MSDTIIAAAISALATIIVVLLANRRVRADVKEVHQVVNSRLDTALELVKSLEAQIRRLKANP